MVPLSTHKFFLQPMKLQDSIDKIRLRKVVMVSPLRNSHEFLRKRVFHFSTCKCTDVQTLIDEIHRSILLGAHTRPCWQATTYEDLAGDWSRSRVNSACYSVYVRAVTAIPHSALVLSFKGAAKVQHVECVGHVIRMFFKYG